MCIAGRVMKNPRYTKTKKNEGVIPPCFDERLKWIEIPCGVCAECRKKKASDWQIRLQEEYKTQRKGQFVTLTISDEQGETIAKEIGTKDSKAIATIMVARFRERWRKKYKTSPRHWLITELGHSGEYKDSKGRTREKTERLHLHGIIFEEEWKFGEMHKLNEYNKNSPRTASELEKIWKYGLVSVGYSEVNERMITYVTKYITKIDNEHKGYYGTILTSPGMGKGYVDAPINKNRHKWNGRKTEKKYKRNDGVEKAMPTYIKNKLWDTKEREMLRRWQMDEEETWVAGYKIDAWDSRTILAAKKQIQQQHEARNLWNEAKANYEWRNGAKTDVYAQVIDSKKGLVYNPAEWEVDDGIVGLCEAEADDSGLSSGVSARPGGAKMDWGGGEEFAGEFNTN